MATDDWGILFFFFLASPQSVGRHVFGRVMYWVGAGEGGALAARGKIRFVSWAFFRIAVLRNPLPSLALEGFPLCFC